MGKLAKRCLIFLQLIDPLPPGQLPPTINHSTDYQAVFLFIILSLKKPSVRTIVNPWLAKQTFILEDQLLCWEVLDSWDLVHVFALDLLGDHHFSVPRFLKLHKENNVTPLSRVLKFLWIPCWKVEEGIWPRI